MTARALLWLLLAASVSAETSEESSSWPAAAGRRAARALRLAAERARRLSEAAGFPHHLQQEPPEDVEEPPRRLQQEPLEYVEEPPRHSALSSFFHRVPQPVLQWPQSYNQLATEECSVFEPGSDSPDSVWTGEDAPAGPYKDVMLGCRSSEDARGGEYLNMRPDNRSTEWIGAVTCKEDTPEDCKRKVAAWWKAYQDGGVACEPNEGTKPEDSLFYAARDLATSEACKVAGAAPVSDAVVGAENAGGGISITLIIVIAIAFVGIAGGIFAFMNKKDSQSGHEAEEEEEWEEEEWEEEG